MRGTVRAGNGKRRVEIVEIAPIDSKRRLLLVRRDRTEHLLLLGTTGDLVIETGIDAPPTPPPEPDPQPGQTVE
jgi:flagellar protein FliO/FliZ